MLNDALTKAPIGRKVRGSPNTGLRMDRCQADQYRTIFQAAANIFHPTGHVYRQGIQQDNIGFFNSRMQVPIDPVNRFRFQSYSGMVRIEVKSDAFSQCDF